MITFKGINRCEVCVEKTLTDDEVKALADMNHPSGARGGWKICRTGHPYLAGRPERHSCISESRCHMILTTGDV